MVAVILFIAFAVINPDKQIVNYNMKKYDSKYMDMEYLTDNMSCDAAGELLFGEKPDEFEDTIFINYYCYRVIEEYEEEYKGDIRKFNVMRYFAYCDAVEYVESIEED